MEDFDPIDKWFSGPVVKKGKSFQEKEHIRSNRGRIPFKRGDLSIVQGPGKIILMLCLESTPRL